MITALQVGAVIAACPVFILLFVSCTQARPERLLGWRDNKGQGPFSPGAVWEVEGSAPAVAVAEVGPEIAPIKLEATPRSRPSSLAERAWSGPRS
jgi:hypothetical protein